MVYSMKGFSGFGSSPLLDRESRLRKRAKKHETEASKHVSKTGIGDIGKYTKHYDKSVKLTLKADKIAAKKNKLSK